MNFNNAKITKRVKNDTRSSKLDIDKLTSPQNNLYKNGPGLDRTTNAVNNDSLKLNLDRLPDLSLNDTKISSWIKDRAERSLSSNKNKLKIDGINYDYWTTEKEKDIVTMLLEEDINCIDNKNLKCFKHKILS